MPTISRSFTTETVSPLLTLGLSFTRVSGNIVHEVLPSSADQQPVPQISYGKLGTREGRLQFLCADYASALAVETFHNYTAGKWTLTDSTNPGANLTYVLAEGGAVTLTLDQDTRKRWLVTLDFKEVPA